MFGGQERWGSPDDRVYGVDGSWYRGRDRFSIAQLNQFALEYRGDFFDDAVTVNIGARAPFFVRELNQYCYSQDGRSTVRCTTETTTPDPVIAGNFRFPSTGTTSWIAPYST